MHVMDKLTPSSGGILKYYDTTAKGFKEIIMWVTYMYERV